ncbi:SDR family NAD(P)-dependent oxidoreductase [candidate division KSB1 bacterium]
MISVKPLDGRTAVVTGSARGIGAGIIRHLASHGARVVINYRSSAAESENLRREISDSGGHALAVKADVTVREEADKLIHRTIDEFGTIDILVNNVGDFLYKRIDEITADEWHTVIASNLDSAFYCILAALPHMRRQEWGRIINIADMRAEKITAQSMKTPYVIAKAGILQLTRSFAVTEAPRGITVNAVSPGFIDSGNYSESFKKRLLEKIPIGRLGTPRDIAQAVLFLVSDNAAYITGANIDVTGGTEL